jgi:hypothetical protein
MLGPDDILLPLTHHWLEIHAHSTITRTTLGICAASLYDLGYACGMGICSVHDLGFTRDQGYTCCLEGGGGGGCLYELRL